MAASMAPVSVTCFSPRSSTSAAGSLPVSSMATNRSLAMRPEIVPSACRSSSLPRCSALIGDSAIVAPRRFSMAKKSPVTSFTASLAPRLLHDLSAALDHFDLTPRLVFDRLLHEADRIHILDLAARTQRIARLAHRDVDVAAHRAFVHVAVAGPKIAHDRAQLGEVGRRLVRSAHVGFA